MKNIFFGCTSSNNKKSKKGKNKKLRRTSSTYGYVNNAPVNRALVEQSRDNNENEVVKHDKETQIEFFFHDVGSQNSLKNESHLSQDESKDVEFVYPKNLHDVACQSSLSNEDLDHQNKEEEGNETSLTVQEKDENEVVDSVRRNSLDEESHSKLSESKDEENEDKVLELPETLDKKPVSTANAKACLWKAIRRASNTNGSASEFKIEDFVGEEGELLNAAAVRKLLQKPTVKSYTYFMICLKKGSTKFVEQILQECDALQLMFDALAALSMKSIGSFTDTILQLEIVRALKMILNSSVGIVYLIDEDRGFVSDLAYGKMLFFFP